jgi:hypothetical protein
MRSIQTIHLAEDSPEQKFHQRWQREVEASGMPHSTGESLSRPSSELAVIISAPQLMTPL